MRRLLHDHGHNQHHHDHHSHYQYHLYHHNKMFHINVHFKHSIKAKRRLNKVPKYNSLTRIISTHIRSNRIAIRDTSLIDWQ